MPMLSLRTAILLAILPLTTSACAKEEGAGQVKHDSGAATQQKIISDLVPIRGGSFLMGDFGPVHNEDKLPYSGAMNDDVLRKITLDDFSIMAHKVSIEDFDAFTDATGRPRVGTSKIDATLYRADSKAAAGVSWQDAVDFCAWAGKKAGRKLVLPTEAQWEFAARSGGKMVIFATDTGTIDDGRNVATYSQYDDGVGTALGKFPPNPAGLYDMTDHGFEWVQDWYEENYSGGDTRNPTGPKNGAERVLRGSSKRGGDSLVHTSMTFARDHRPPNPEKSRDPNGEVIDVNQNRTFGFRCATQD
ncbi:formylglycine-generating enzyme family protein [Stenotrophomonas indicatrix]|uniref:formylglycine-generating enzyme family protein n=1 Tax=Stenotrophomonas indicatrix TaxID=2045451 RepID=UPI001AA186D6|nr:SUMF1/EgtB/PvdO family nonheme iron enzyme [Stenotrophomonas indicatrix]MBO1748572.1 SUMF1/EgtB/PvdO family nonheme iron enzyme [Stenotrophomonas indicatrix]